MRSSTDLSPAAQRLLDYLLDGRYQADQYDLRDNLGMSLQTALRAADEIKTKGYPIEACQGRLTYFRYTGGTHARG